METGKIRRKNKVSNEQNRQFVAFLEGFWSYNPKYDEKFKSDIRKIKENMRRMVD